MNDYPTGETLPLPARVSMRTAAEAKSRLLAWANERDAAAARRERQPVGGAAVLGIAVAAMGGLALVRTLLPRRRSVTDGTRSAPVGARLVRLAFIVRTGVWLLPMALKVVKSFSRPAVAK